VLPHLQSPWCSEVLVLCALVLFECTAVTILAVNEIRVSRVGKKYLELPLLGVLLMVHSILLMILD